MDILTVILYLLIASVLFIWYYDKDSRSKNAPPGPFVFPVVGIFPHFLRSSFLDKMHEWKIQYGNIFSIKFASMNAVIISDFNWIKEAFNSEELTGRPLFGPIRAIAGDNARGLTASEGEQWENQRRFALRHLRDFGFGKKSSEMMAQEDIVDLIEKFKKDVGTPISTGNRFNMSVINGLWHIIAGRRYDLDDPEFEEVLKKMKTAVSQIVTNTPLFAMEWLTNIAPDATGWNKFKTAMDGAKEFVQEQIDFHKETFQDGNFRDFIDVYINETKKDNKHASFDGIAGDENLLVGVLNLFAAGAETTSSTLSWALYFLSRNPSIQKKLQVEIDTVIGRSRLPSLSDRDSMPYCNAIILEVFRKSSLVPLGVPHKALRDFNFHGYTIKKDTTVFANLYDVHHDKAIWKNPNSFKPERFLKEDGTLDKNHPVIAPFSVGRRQCLGETLARNNVFLFFVSLFQAFDIKEPKGAPVVNIPMGFFRQPPDFKVVFEERKMD